MIRPRLSEFFRYGVSLGSWPFFVRVMADEGKNGRFCLGLVAHCAG